MFPCMRTINAMKCTDTDEAFGGVSNQFKTHELKDEMLFQCHLCCKKFRLKKYRQRHLRTHDRNREAKHKCDQCSKTFFQRKSLVNHRAKLHVGETAFRDTIDNVPNDEQGEIDECLDVPFKSEISQDTKRFKCNLCPAQFHEACILNIHQLMHKDENLFKCRQCSMRYRTKQNLLKHKAIYHVTKSRGEISGSLVYGKAWRPKPNILKRVQFSCPTTTVLQEADSSRSPVNETTTDTEDEDPDQVVLHELTKHARDIKPCIVVLDPLDSRLLIASKIKVTKLNHTSVEQSDSEFEATEDEDTLSKCIKTEPVFDDHL